MAHHQQSYAYKGGECHEHDSPSSRAASNAWQQLMDPNRSIIKILDLELGDHMHPEHKLELDLIQAFAGDFYEGGVIGNHHGLEYHWYTYWAHALFGFFSTTARGLHLAPQFIVSKLKLTQDGNLTRISKIPDFCLLFLDGRRKLKSPQNIITREQVVNRQTLAKFYQGDCVVDDSALVLICEIKALPKIPDDLEDAAFLSTFNRRIMRAFAVAQVAVVEQLRHYFSQHKHGGIVAIACVGNRFCWSDYEYGDISPASSNVDSTYPSNSDKQTAHSEDSWDGVYVDRDEDAGMYVISFHDISRI